MLGSAEQFRTRYAIPVERHGLTEPASGCAPSPGPICCAGSNRPVRHQRPAGQNRDQTDCQLTTEQASLYQSVVDDMMEKIEKSDGIERRGNVLAAMAKLKQVCNHPALLLHDPLCDRAPLREGDPAGGNP